MNNRDYSVQKLFVYTITMIMVPNYSNKYKVHKIKCRLKKILYKSYKNWSTIIRKAPNTYIYETVERMLDLNC